MPSITKNDINAGQAPYNKWVLSVYDIIVLGVFSRFVWKCPPQLLLDHYNQNISSNHLDAGVGTGYFLDNCRFPSKEPRLALMDLNKNCLEVTGRRLERYRPKTYFGDVYEPFNVGNTRFDSLAINGLLHCIPGTMKDKGVVFDNAKQVLNPSGIIFGCTVIGKGIKKGLAAKLMLCAWNKSKIFSNLKDGLSELKEELSKRFDNVKIEVIGCMALFRAQ